MLKEVHLPQPVLKDHPCLLGEGPVWDMHHQVIFWIDILNGEIHEYNPSFKTHRTISVGQMIGSFALCTDGNFIAALQHGFAFIDRTTGAVKIITDPERHLSGNRFNEGKCDPAGRFLAGTMAFSEESSAGSLYVLQKDLTTRKLIADVSISNGMAWSGDHNTFYFIDSPTKQVMAYDYDKSRELISNKRTVIRIADEEGFPDGMTIDAEGMLWIGHWNGWQVARWNPHTGVKLLQIKMPVAKVTSCTFGGERLEDLYITTARVDLTEGELKKQPLAGSLFVVRNCGYKGVLAFEFKINE